MLIRLIVILVTFIYSLSAGDITLEISKKVNIVNPSLTIESDNNSKLSRRVYSVMIKDLNVLSYFDVIEKFNKNSFDDTPKLLLKKYNYVLKYKSVYKGKGAVIYIALYNERTGKEVYKNSYSIKNSRQYVFLVHYAIIDINKFFKLPDVSWMNRLVVFSKVMGRMNNHIVVSDYTLTYQRTVVVGGLNVFPKWANKKQTSIYYSNFSGRIPKVYKLNLHTGKKRFVAQSQGMIAVSDVTNNGREALLTLAPNGYSNIFLYYPKSNKLKQLTNSRFINVNGNFVNGGRQVVYVSDRLGYPNIFSKDLSSGKIKRMVFYSKNNSSMNAYKNYIVYSSRESDTAFSRNTFNLHLMSTRTNVIRRLTSSGINLFPRFSNNGNAILFIKKYARNVSLGIIKLNDNRSFIFPLSKGKDIQSIDW